jgi:N-glycosylase/DNA lyase
MKILQQNNSVILEDVKDFNLTHTFECGQCFRWDKIDDDSYVGIVEGKALIASQKGSTIELKNTTLEEFQNFWFDYFNLGKDYSAIKDNLSQDKVLKEAIKFGWGIRILKQSMWECLISYIISANNRIPMIKRAVRLLSEHFGSPIHFEDKTYYSFPTPLQLSKATEEDLEKCSTGFRAKYIKKVVDIFLNGEIDLENIKELETSAAHEELKKLPGVGPKIADCVLLFSAAKYDAFPTDVWVKRVMEYFYSEGELKLSQIQNMAKEMFGDMAGFAQEYLFYYAREFKIGK